jgi:DMSO reductase anchor subunit
MNGREWPLVLFTLIGQAAAGLAFFLILPLYFFPALTSDRSWGGLRLGAPLIILALLGAAALLSLFHLGNPTRAVRALANTGASWLSKEILAEIIFMGATAGLAYLAWKAPGSPAGTTLAVLVVAEAAAFVYSMGKIYTIPAVPEWNSAATRVSFFASALGLGSMAAALAVRGAIPFIDGAPGTRLDSDLHMAALAVAGGSCLVALLFSPGFGLLIAKRPSRVYAPKRAFTVIFIVRIVLLLFSGGIWAFVVFHPAAPLFWVWAGFGLSFLSETLGRLLFYSLPDGL